MIAPPENWQVPISIAGLGAIVNIGITLIINSVTVGRKMQVLDTLVRDVEEVKRGVARNETEIGRVRENFAAATGKTINGKNYRGGLE